MLDAVIETLNTHQLNDLLGRLNADKIQSLSGEWELLVLFGLQHWGRISYETSLGGPSCPDISFELYEDPTIKFAADITCISDRGLHDMNPIFRLMDMVRERAHRLGIRSGGFDYRVWHEPKRGERKAKVRLKMPEAKRLERFFQTTIVPELKSIAAAPSKPWSFQLRDEQHDIQISYRPGSRYSSASHPDFRQATVIDSNPLYNSLEEKRKQLKGKGYNGPKGIIVCDGGCQTLTSKVNGLESFSKSQIINKFFKSNPDISFVLLLWVENPFRRPGESRVCEAYGELFLNPVAKITLPLPLQDILLRIPERWPSPVQTGENARLELGRPRYGKAKEFWGHSFHGGHRLGAGSNSLTFRMSARGVVDILAGRMTYAEFAEAHGFAPTEQSPNQANPLASAIGRGFTISSVTLEQVPNEDDDWIEFRLTGPDPAIAPFRTANPRSIAMPA